MDRKPMQQFQYCSFCKTSHKQKKNHVYSKRHQQIITRILHKFSEKVKLAKSTLDGPDIQDVGYEYGAKFWCYFCVDDFNKHLLLDVCTSKFSGLLEHISEDTHRTSVFKFLQDHRIDAEKCQASTFLLSQESLKKFKQALEVAIRRYEERKKLNIKQESELIKREENRRRITLHTLSSLEVCLNTNTSEPQSKKQRTTTVSSVQQKTLPHVQRKTTLTAHGQGLTFIGTQSLQKDEGNVHSEDLPPWLQEEEEVNPTRTEIGPTIEDYNKHLEREKCKKLPPGRVGAKFDHTSTVSSQWLPSFGRVWNTGRRQQSEVFFRKEMSQSKSTGNFLNKYKLEEDQTGEKKSTMVSSASSSILIKPYVKKKRISEDTEHNVSNSRQNSHNVSDSGQTFPQDLLPPNSNDVYISNATTIGNTSTYTSGHYQQPLSWHTVHTNQQGGGTSTGNIFQPNLRNTETDGSYQPYLSSQQEGMINMKRPDSLDSYRPYKNRYHTHSAGQMNEFTDQNLQFQNETIQGMNNRPDLYHPYSTNKDIDVNYNNPIHYK